MPGPVSKWRVRYARDRMAGLSEIGSAVLTQSMGKSKLPNGRSLVSRTITSGTGRRLCSRRSRWEAARLWGGTISAAGGSSSSTSWVWWLMRGSIRHRRLFSLDQAT